MGRLEWESRGSGRKDVGLIHDVIYIHDEHFVAAVAYRRLAYSSTRPVKYSPTAAIMSSYC